MRINKKTLKQTIKTDGSILYCFNINGKRYVGQSTRGFWRIYNHFGLSYYYSRESGSFKDIEDLGAQKHGMYADLRQVS